MRALDGMNYSSEQNDHDVSRWHGWNILAPLIYLGTLALLIYGDLYVFILRFAALFGQPASTLPIGLDSVVSKIGSAQNSTVFLSSPST